MEHKYYVYGLYEKGEQYPFYIGKGSGDRMFRHLKESSLAWPYHKNYKIKSILKNGGEVIPTVIFEDLSEDQAHNLEVYMIAALGRQNDGGCLTNHNKGGEGNSRQLSQSTKDKIGASSRGRKCTQAQKDATSLRFKGKKLSPELIEKGRLAKLGEKNPCAKLKETDVTHVWLLHYEGCSNTEIGKIFGVHRRTVSDIIRMKTWKSVSDRYITAEDNKWQA